MNVSVVGSGYVGTTIAACFADLGHDVTAIDIDEEIVARLNDGHAPIHEPGLDDLLAEHAGERLRATTDYDAITDGDVTFLALPTPRARTAASTPRSSRPARGRSGRRSPAASATTSSSSRAP